MKRQQIATALVCLAIGFIIGFFLSKAVGTEEIPVANQASGELPANHPSPEDMARLQALLEQARSEPENRKVRVDLANSFYDMGRFDAAIPWYEEALEMEPSDVMVSTDLATSYLYTGKIDEALSRYEKSLSIEPNHPQTLQNLGIAHFSTGDYQNAIDVWGRLLEIHPEYPNADDVKRQIDTARMHLTTEAASP